MSGDTRDRQSYLDRIRLTEGPERCRRVLVREHMNDNQKAIELINDRDLSFPCLYLLLPQIGLLKLSQHLNTRNYIAAVVSEQVTGTGDTAESDFLSEREEPIRDALRWMIRSGSPDGGMDNAFHRILDIAASALTVFYKDSQILPGIRDLIFERKKKGLNNNNLVWAFFKSGDPETLRLTAEKLISPHAVEADYARELLGLSPPEGGEDADGRTQYGGYTDWLAEKKSRLYFTGEDHQLSSRPVICAVGADGSGTAALPRDGGTV